MAGNSFFGFRRGNHTPYKRDGFYQTGNFKRRPPGLPLKNTNPTFTGTIAATIAAFAASITANFVRNIGTISAQMGAFTANIAATFSELINGTITAVIPPFIATISAVFNNGEIVPIILSLLQINVSAIQAGQTDSSRITQHNRGYIRCHVQNFNIPGTILVLGSKDGNTFYPVTCFRPGLPTPLENLLISNAGGGANFIFTFEKSSVQNLSYLQFRASSPIAGPNGCLIYCY